jgi:large conductance mechanosensitive channel
MSHHHVQHAFDPEKIKDEIKQYREFALKKNMLEISVALMLATSFNKMVTALSENILMPVIGFLTNSSIERNWRNLEFKIYDGLTIEAGKFVGSTLDFLIISVCLYVFYMKLFTPLLNKICPKSDIEKTCQYCQMIINVRATRCPYCIKDLTDG